MELLRLLLGIQFHLVVGCQDFIRDRSPAILFNTVIPSVEVVILWFVVLDVQGFLPLLLLDLVVVPWCKCIDVHDTTMSEDFIVYQRWEAITSKPEPDMAPGCSIQKTSLSRVDTLQQLTWLSPI